MGTIETTQAGGRSAGHLLLRGGIVLLTLATAAIHVTLGGLLFLANAAGYVVLAAGMVAPAPISRARPLIRVALLGFTTMTIASWLLFGARFSVAYVDKGIELVLVALLLVEMWVCDGGPIGVIRWGRRCLAQLTAAVTTAVR